MYKIKLNNMQFSGHIGVLPEEKVVGQKIEVDLIVETAFDFNGGDNIDDSLSYVPFYEVTEKIVSGSRVNLIEKLAYDIIQAVRALDSELIAAVEVHVRKIAVPIDGIFDHTEIEMRG